MIVDNSFGNDTFVKYEKESQEIEGANLHIGLGLEPPQPLPRHFLCLLISHSHFLPKQSLSNLYQNAW